MIVDSGFSVFNFEYSVFNYGFLLILGDTNSTNFASNFVGSRGDAAFHYLVVDNSRAN